MKIFDNLFKKAIIHARDANKRTLFFRWLTLAVIFFILWSFSALVFSSFLFTLSDDVISGSANILEFSLQFISLYFKPPVLFFVFSIIFASLFAYKCVENYFISIHGKTNLIISRFTLWKRVFGTPKAELIKITDLKIDENGLQHLKKIGGPARIMVPAENAALLEDHNHQVHIIGPTMNLPDNIYLMNNFELLRDVINLQNQSIQMDVKIQTKDGQQLLIKNLQAIFSVHRDRKTSTLTRPYPFNTHSIFRLYYCIAPGTLQDKFGNILKCGLIHFFRQINSSELFRVGNNLSAKTERIQSQIRLPSIFRKRQRFSAILRKPIFSFFQKHIQKKSWFTQRRMKNFRRLYLDAISSTKTQTRILEEQKSKNFMDFIKIFQTDINPYLEKKGFQLHLLSYGTIEFQKRNERINLNEFDGNEVKYSEKYFQNQITQLLKYLNDSNNIFADLEYQKEILKKIRTILESSLNTEKGKLKFRDRQLEKAIDNIDQIIISQG